MSAGKCRFIRCGGDQAYRKIASLAQPGEDGKAEGEGKGILDGCERRHRLTCNGTVAIYHVSYAHRGNCTDGAMVDGGSGDGNEGVELVLDSAAPQHESQGCENGGNDEGPEAKLRDEVTATSLGNGGGYPVTDRSSCYASKEARDDIL